MARKKLALLMLTGLLVFLAACQPSQPTPTPFPTFTPAPTATITPTPTPVRVAVSTTIDPVTRANVSFLLAVPDAPVVDVYVESSLGAARLSYGKLTSAFALAPDKYSVRVVPAGQSAQSDKALFAEVIEFAPTENVLLVFTGTPESLKLLRHAQDVAPLPTGSARLAFVNALADGSPVTLALNDEVLGEAQNGGQPIVAPTLRPGRNKIKIEGSGKILFDDSVTLQDRAAHLVILYGSQPTLAVAIAPTIREARMRVLHAMRGLGPIDVFLNDQPVAQNIDYRGVTEWRAFTAGTYTVRVKALTGPAEEAEVFTGQIALNPDLTADLVIYEVHTLIGQGESRSRPDARAQLFAEDLRPTSIEKTRLAVLNMARLDTNIQVMNPSFPMNGFPQINYGAISSGVTLPAGPQELAFNTTGSSTVDTLETAAGLDFRPGIVYLYVVLGDPANRTPLIFSTDVGIEGGGATPTPTNAVFVRLVNALDGVESLDLFVGDTPIIQNVKYGEGSDIFTAPNDNRPVSIRKSGIAITLASLPLASAPDGEMLFVAIGTADSPQLLQSAEPARAPVGFSILHLIHAAAHGPQLSLESPRPPPARPSSTGPTPTPGRTQYIRLAKYLDISQIVRLRPASYTFIVRNVQDNSIVGQFDGVNIQLRKRYIVLALPDGDSVKFNLIVTDNAQ